MINHRKIFFIALVVFNCKYAFAKMHEYETTKLKSQGGSGVGSIHLEESAFLNPAPIIFYGISSIYYQNDSHKYSDNLQTSYSKFKSHGFVLAQGEPNIGGTFSYYQQKELNYIRKSWGASMAGSIGSGSSFGFSVRRNTDINQLNNFSKDYYQAVFGVTHILNDDTSMGVVLYDPFKSYAHETKILVGIQRNIVSYIFGNFDIGGDYNQELSKTLIWKAGVQVKVLDDFFIRAGTFNDKIKAEKGESIGLAWIQPRLSLEAAMKTTKQTTGSNPLTDKETSFSISMRGF